MIFLIDIKLVSSIICLEVMAGDMVMHERRLIPVFEHC